MAAARTVDEYVAASSDEVRELLTRVRERLRATVPDAGEAISYQMPTVTMDGTALLYYAAWKKHLGVYPVPFGDAGYEALVGPYRAAKDAVHFPYRTPFPWDVLDRIVRLAVSRRLSG